MDTRDKFSEDIFSGFSNVDKDSVARKSPIIRNQAIKLGTPHKIHSKEEHRRIRSHQPQVLPIKKNGEIIGFISECACGEVVKVYFEYEPAV